jgi:hypothetical protein
MDISHLQGRSIMGILCLIPKGLYKSLKSLTIRDNMRPRRGRTNFVQIHFYGYLTPLGVEPILF